MIKFNTTNESNSCWLHSCVWVYAMVVLPFDITSAQDAATKASHTNKVHVEDNDYWDQFRGPNGDGKSLAKDLPVEFSETKNLRWKTPIHDKGWSSPVVWGNQIWLTTGREDGSELFAICVDRESGNIIHDIKVFDVAKPQKAYGGLNTHATPTPIVEDGRIYVHFGTYGTACLDTISGKNIWGRRDLNCDHRVRPASSPIIDNDSLFLHFDGVDAQFIVALDKGTGETLWLQNREVDSDLGAVLKAEGLSEADIEATKEAKPNDNRKAYATPKLIEYQGQRQLISPGAEVTSSYDPADGQELWRVRHPGWGWNSACRPIFEHGLAYVVTGFSRYLMAVRPSRIGDVTETHIAWSTRSSTPSIPSPLIVDDLLFMVSDQGYVSCLEPETGRQLWKERLRAGGDHWASPVYADGKIYCCGKKRVVSVIAAARDFQLLAENEMDASFIASPAVAGDAIILRSLTHLYCVSTTTGDDGLEVWYNCDNWDVAGGAALNPDNHTRLAGKAGAGVLINGKDGKCPSLVTKRRDYRDVQVYVEFMIAGGSNSGVIFHGNHEIQILDSYGIEKPTAGHCGGVYPRAESEPTYRHIDKGSPPRVNAARPAGQWQSLDIIFQAARFDEAGNKTAHARFVKVVHNGKVIQEDVEVPYACGPNWDRKQYPQGPIIIQGDYGPIAVRNVRIKEWSAHTDKELNVPPEGFTALFNGKDLTGWRVHPKVREMWKIEDGVLKSHGLLEEWGADLVTEKEYQDCVLMVDFLMPAKSDSGIHFRNLSPQMIGKVGDAEQFNIRSKGGMGHLESFNFLPDNMRLTKDQLPQVGYIDPEIGVWHTVKLTVVGKNLTAELDGEVILDHFEYPEGILSTKPNAIRFQEHRFTEGDKPDEKNPCPRVPQHFYERA